MTKVKPQDRDFDSLLNESDRLRGGRKAVCKRCKYALVDHEPMSFGGEFYHPKTDKQDKRIDCSNAGQTFDTESWEIEPFMRKRDRRAEKRLQKLNKRK